MAVFKADKVVASLPTPLTANTLYVVRKGVGVELYCSDSTGGIAHTLNPKRVHRTLSANFSTNQDSLQPVEGMNAPLLANRSYRIEFIGAVRSSGSFGGAGVGLLLPVGATVTGCCRVQVSNNSADSLLQHTNSIVSATSWLANNDEDNPVEGVWVVTTTQAGGLQLGIRSNSSLYTAVLQGGKCLMTVEEIGG